MGIDTYNVQGTAGHTGTPGAPILHFSLLVQAGSGFVSGQANITQTTSPPTNIQINNVTGRVRSFSPGIGPVSQVVTLQGTYGQPGPPPTNYIIEEKFTAHFVTDSEWNGKGAFTYGSHDVDDVPVRSRVGSPIHTLYGVVIHDATASGDLARMKAVAAQAERHVAATPDVQTALAALKAEIAKAGG